MAIIINWDVVGIFSINSINDQYKEPCIFDVEFISSSLQTERRPDWQNVGKKTFVQKI